MKRLVFVCDEHYPHVIPAYHDLNKPYRETAFIKFLKDFQPHVFVHGGDQLDLDCIAHWNKGKPRLVEGKRLKSVYDNYNRLLDTQERALKHTEKIVMLEGNHDRWISDMLDAEPALEGLIEVDRNLRIKERGYTWIDRGKHYKFGKMHFIHGDYQEGYTAAYHAKAIANIYGKSVMYGHFHSNQTYAAKTPFDERPYQTYSVGCMSNVNPMWKRNKPSAWLNSFAAITFLDNGNYFATIVNIVNGQFVFDGKLYK